MNNYVQKSLISINDNTLFIVITKKKTITIQFYKIN